MADQVQEVKQRVDIVSVIGSRVDLKPAGKYMKGLCPFHSEKSPSFFVSPEMQIYKCYGCGKGGDVFSFLQDYEGITFREALEDLAEKVGVELQSYQPDDSEKVNTDLRRIMSLASEYYHFILTQHELGQPAREYLKKRQVNRVLIDKFNLGFAPNSWHNLENYLVKKKGFTRELIEQAGLLISRQTQAKSTGYYDRFRNRIMFPLTDFRGQVVGFSGRTLETDSQEAKYINTPETKLYHKRELLFGIDQARPIIRKKNQVILVEGEFDVISSVAAGVAHVVGIKGSAVTEEHIRLIMRLTKNITLCLDADAAGDAATKRGIEMADKLGMNVSVLALKTQKDPDEIARTQPKQWLELVKKTQSIYEFYIDSAFEAHDVQTGTGKKQIAAELAPVLSKISNVVEQDHYLHLVSSRLKVDISALRAEVEKYVKASSVSSGSTKTVTRLVQKQVEPADPIEKIERHLWSWWLQQEPDQAREQFELINRTWENPGLRRLAELVLTELKSSRDFNLQRFTQSLPLELQELVQQLYLENVTVAQLKPEHISPLIGQADKLVAKKRLQQLTKEISALESQDSLTTAQTHELKQLQQTVSLLIRQLHQEAGMG